MKTAVILDSEFNSTHPMEAVMNRRGFVVLRAGTTEEVVKLLKSAGAPVDLVIVEAPLRYFSNSIVTSSRNPTFDRTAAR